MVEAISTRTSSRPRGVYLLRLIGIFKVIKATALVIAAIVVLKLIHRDITEVIANWARRFHIAPGTPVVEHLVEKVLMVTHRQLFVLAMVLFAYAGMFLIEGIGLLMMKHWAEWMTVITTSGLIPFEVYELIHRPTGVKAAAMVVNIAIAIYLVVHVRNESRAAKQADSINPN
jgi:uncharacterized membrane protein (DUF2068 family)